MKRKYDLNILSSYRSELMGLAILFVMVFHFTENYTAAYNSGSVDTAGNSFIAHLILMFNTYVGSIGVELFTILSAIGLYYSFSRNPDILSFYRRRIKRIIFPYTVVAVIFWSMKDLYLNQYGIFQFVKDFFFISFFTEGVKTIWFILFILAAYLIFPLFYRYFCIGKNRFMYLCAFLIMYTVLLYFIYSGNRAVYNRIEIAAMRIPLFAVGCFSAPYVKDGKRISLFSAILITVLCFSSNIICVRCKCSAFVMRLADSLFGTGLLIFLAGCCAKCFDHNCQINKVLRFFGKYSLELYMIHVTIRNLMGMTAYKPYYTKYYIILVAVSIGLSILLRKVQNSIAKS